MYFFWPSLLTTDADHSYSFLFPINLTNPDRVQGSTPMQSLHVYLPLPPGPLKRQIGVDAYGLSLSPIPISRSVSNTSNPPESCEERTARQLRRYLSTTLSDIEALQYEVNNIRLAIKESRAKDLKHTLNLLSEKEKLLVLARKKLKRTQTLLDTITRHND